MLSKRHYVAIAGIVSVATKSSVDGRSYRNDAVITSLAEDLADYFASDNPTTATRKGFDRARFLEACGIEADK